MRPPHRDLPELRAEQRMNREAWSLPVTVLLLALAALVCWVLQALGVGAR